MRLYYESNGSFLVTDTQIPVRVWLTRYDEGWRADPEAEVLPFESGPASSVLMRPVRSRTDQLQ